MKRLKENVQRIEQQSELEKMKEEMTPQLKPQGTRTGRITGFKNKEKKLPKWQQTPAKIIPRSIV